jgi:hypothetical protein
MYFKLLEKQEQAKPKINRWKETIKNRAEMKGKLKKKIQRIKKQGVGSLKR